ncbi:MAG TPA: IS1 family transposase [Longimicrobiaceae bacterium]
MNILADNTRAAILRALCEGNSIRATARLTGTSKATVSDLLRIVGAHCKNHHDRFTRDVACKRVQMDEIWSFVASKEKNTSPEMKERGHGDVWTWTALCQDSKLLVAYRVGDRNAPTANAFVEDLEERLSNRVQLTSDGLKLYLRAVEDAFGWAWVDYAQLVKIYGQGSEVGPARRYSPGEYVRSEKVAIMGRPNMEDVTTSHVERNNLTMRMQMRRFTRLTNAFSKKVEYHLYAVALHAMFYNYARPHATLTKARKGMHTTPAMAAGLTDRVWTVYDLLDLLDGR